jgi:outer membrane protein TolC
MLSAQDTVQYFAQNQFFELVKANHPIAQQAGLLDRMAIENLKVAKAGFDPKIKSDWERKQFNDKQYFNIWKSGVNLPTWYGLEVNAGYDVASGEFLNPENYLPKQGVGYLGISANVLYQSGQAYWDWAFASNQLVTYREALGLAGQRYQIIKQNYQIGEVAGIDTLKALLQVQTREIEYNEAENDLQNAITNLSNFLWQNGKPSSLQLNTAAPNLKRLSPNIPNTNFNENHPELLKVEYKLSALQVDERLKKEKLKPKLKVKYNLLGQEFDILQNGQNDGVVVAQNYKAGVQFEMNPILRSERANLELNRIKMEQTNFEITNKRLTLQNKLNAYLNDWNNNQQQLNLTRNMVNNYQLLLRGEMEKFKVGESDLFIVNTRETQLIEAEIKLLKLLAKQQKIVLSLIWINGDLR